jgi:hypothetical protein
MMSEQRIQHHTYNTKELYDVSNNFRNKLKCKPSIKN